MSIEVIEVLVAGLQGPRGTGLPEGGTAGQVPVKQSAANFDIVWEDIAEAERDTALQIVAKLATLLGDERLDASSVKNIPVLSSAQIVAKLEALTGISRLDAKAIQNLPVATKDSAAQIVAKIETLIGDDRLDASSIKNIPVATRDTAAEIVAKVETLTGDDRLSASAVKDIPAETGQTIVAKVEALIGAERLDATKLRNLPAAETAEQTAAKLETLTGDDRPSASAVKDIPTETGQTIVAKVEALSGAERLDATKLKNLPAAETAEQTAAKLETLTGDDRLDASAVKNLPAAGGIPEAPLDDLTYGRKGGAWEQVFAQQNSTNANPNGKWVNLVEFPQIPFGEISTIVSELSLLLKGTTSSFELFTKMRSVVLQGTDETSAIQIESRISNYANGSATEAKYRLVRESNSTYSQVKLQFFSSLDEDLEGIVINNLSTKYPAGVTFGSALGVGRVSYHQYDHFVVYANYPTVDLITDESGGLVQLQLPEGRRQYTINVITG